MKVIEIHPEVCHKLFIQGMLTELFFGAPHPHPDSSRQRKAKRRDRDRREARELKGKYVPLYFVDPTVWIENLDAYSGNWVSHRVSLTGRSVKKDVHAVYMPSPSGAWRRHELSA